MNEFEYEHSPGLPAPLPAGERILWRGSPAWWPFACSVFHVRGLTLYFAALLAAQLALDVRNGHGPADMLVGATWMLFLAVVALGLLLGASVLYARTTIYTITDRRVVLRFGLAVPLAVNLPFCAVLAADARPQADGGSDVALTLERAQRVSVVQMWPCIQTWRLRGPRPMLRALPPGVAERLGEALRAAAGGEHPVESAQTGLAAPPAAVAA